MELADGVHKYVTVKAVHLEELWFVKSCNAKDCGRPTTGVISFGMEWLRILDFDVTVTGGGRIVHLVRSRQRAG